MKTPLIILSSTAFILALAGCKSSSVLELKGTVTQASGQVSLRTSNGDTVVLNTAAIGTGVTASFYDASGNAALSIRFAKEVDPMILSFAEKTVDMAGSVEAANAHAVATNQPVTVDLSRGQVVPVHQEWDGTQSCVYWQGTVQQCDSSGNCQNVTQTIYGTANYHYVKSGNINYDELKLSESSNSAVMELIDDQTSTTSTQTSACIEDPQ